MTPSVIVWDIETVPDLHGFAAAKGLVGKPDNEVRAEMGDKFTKLIYHSIVCIGAVVAQWEQDHWEVLAIGAPNVGERSEKEIISAFVNRIAELSPQLVTFNGEASLHELCRVMGLPGKPDGIDGSEVENYVREGRIAEVAAYCETDVVNTYRVWLRYELFRKRLTENGLHATDANLAEHIRSRSNTKPHLQA